MEVGKHIKRHRSESGFSQEELAAKIYVSRQTVSNWETDKTYPDVQSLLLLSVLFDVTIDELIKGDVESMKQAVAEDRRKMWVLAWVMLGFLAAMFGALVGGLVFWDWGLAPTVVVALLLWGIAMAAAFAIEHLKKKHDVVTYRELIAFDKGLPIDRDNERSRRARKHPVIKGVAITLIAACVGAIIGYFAGYLLF